MAKNAHCCFWGIPCTLLLATAALSLSGCPARAPHVPEYVANNPQRITQIRHALIEGIGEVAVVPDVPDPDGWGTFVGTFRFETEAARRLAQPRFLDVTGGDAAFCLRGGPIASEEVVVDPNTGAIENVIIFFADNVERYPNRELWLHPDKSPGANTEPVIYDQIDCVFTTHVLAMQVSQPLLIRNSDGVGHNTKLDNTGRPISPSLAPGGEAAPYLHAREEREPYPVSCNIHPWMRAFILPRSNGYFAVTGGDGRFSIENLPAEVDLTMRVWHEKVGFVRAVTVNGQGESWPVRGFKVRVPKDGQLSMDIVVDAAPFF